MDDTIGDVCAICLDDLSCRPAGTKGRGKVKTYTIKACQHSFHKACISEWYSFESKRGKVCACPLCRTDDTKHPSYRRLMREQEKKAKRAEKEARGPGLFARLLRAATRRGQPSHPGQGGRARSNTQPARAPQPAQATRPRANTSSSATQIVATNPNVPGSMYIFNGSVRQTNTGGSVFILDSAFEHSPPQPRTTHELRRRETVRQPPRAQPVAAH